MKYSWILGLAGALLAHGVIGAFGGILFPGTGASEHLHQDVELLQDADKAEDEPEASREPPVESPELEAEAQQLAATPDLAPPSEPVALDDAPALDAASLSAIEQALNGRSGSNDFGTAVDFSSGGRIDGTGRPGKSESEIEGAFSLSEIDQRPRAVSQPQPTYPSEMRSKKLEALVTVIFVVDESGRVVQPRVERSTNPGFDKAALDAVRQWRFEPAVKSGQRVSCKLRAPIRFQPS